MKGLECVLQFSRNIKLETIGPNVTKVCKTCKQEKPLDAFYRQGAVGSRSECIKCYRLNLNLYSRIRKNQVTPDPGTPCECCGDSTRSLQWDHDHETKEHRGWICWDCNVGIGKLGDNLEGVTKAVEYLKKANNIQEPENEINGVCDI